MILANTFYNAKKMEVAPSEKRNGKKRVAFAEKLVHRPQHMAVTHTAGFNHKNSSNVKLRSILKGDQEGYK